MTRGEFTGAVIAGGQSRRMGRDKALLTVDGELMWRRQACVLQAAGAAVVGVVRQRGQAPLGLLREIRLWHDSVVGVGPLAGLHAALAVCQHEWLAVLAVDMPCIDGNWFHWLREHCGPQRGAMAWGVDGHAEPLAAIYPRAALPEVEQRLRSGPRSLQSLADALVAQGRLASVPLPAGQSWRAANWNTPAEAVACRSAGPPVGAQNPARRKPAGRNRGLLAMVKFSSS